MTAVNRSSSQGAQPHVGLHHHSPGRLPRVLHPGSRRRPSCSQPRRRPARPDRGGVHGHPARRRRHHRRPDRRRRRRQDRQGGRRHGRQDRGRQRASASPPAETCGTSGPAIAPRSLRPGSGALLRPDTSRILSCRCRSPSASGRTSTSAMKAGERDRVDGAAARPLRAAEGGEGGRRRRAGGAAARAQAPPRGRGGLPRRRARGPRGGRGVRGDDRSRPTCPPSCPTPSSTRWWRPRSPRPAPSPRATWAR